MTLQSSDIQPPAARAGLPTWMCRLRSAGGLRGGAAARCGGPVSGGGNCLTGGSDHRVLVEVTELVLKLDWKIEFSKVKAKGD